MRDWDRLFKSADKAGVYSVIVKAELERAQRAAAASGLDVFRINLTEVADKQGLLRAVAEALSFPEYFGMNWDALEECLTDLSWLLVAGYIVFITGTRRFTESSAADMKTAGQIFKSAASYWKGKKVPFYAVLSR
jgi:RNAse (barnase) inhibitor barstar